MLTMPKWPDPSFKHRSITSLDNMYKILEKLGNPHLKLPEIIHIAGTNGKGSTVAFLRTILEKSGYKVHAYTSPHLIYFNERIYLAGELIDDNYLNQLLEKCKYACNQIGINPAFFEGSTAAAFMAFSEIEADFLIMETGMGGRLDPTNVIENNLASIITPVSYDHTNHLGSDLYTIAKQKAGIIKPNRPCFLSLQTDEAFEAISEKCQESFSPLIAFGYDYGLEIVDNGFLYKDAKNIWEFPLPSLIGDHQIINAGCVISTLSHLNIEKVNYETIKQGITSTKWPGRLQKITSGKYFSMIKNTEAEIWIDGAHNPHGSQALALWAKRRKNKPINLILGMTKDRNVEAFLSPFASVIEQVYAVKVEDELLAASTSYLAKGAKSAGFKVTESSSISDAVEDILNHTPNSIIIITGSLYLNSDVLYN